MLKDTYSQVVFSRNEYVSAASLIFLHGKNKKNHKTGHSYKQKI